MKKALQNEKGLTLVEVVVAMFILSIGILTAMTLLTTGIKVSDSNQDKVYALNLAEEKMEEWKYKPNISSMLDDLENDSVTRGNSVFNVQVTKSSAGSNLIQITVDVRWNNNSQVVSLSTIKQV